jgi:ribosome-binding factor A
MRRVNQILREAIADECADLKDPRIGFLTITDVDTAPDLRRATVFYSVMGDDAVHKATAAALASAASRIRTAVGTQIRMKYLPELIFEVDPSIEYGLKISSILANLDKEPVSDDSE